MEGRAEARFLECAVGGEVYVSVCVRVRVRVRACAEQQFSLHAKP
jgi:hypothetical protein